MKELKDQRISTTCSKVELEKIKQMASDNNMSIAEFIRARVLSEVAPKYDLFESRALKILCINAAWIQLQSNELTDDKFGKFLSLIKEVKKKNDLDDVADSEKSH